MVKEGKINEEEGYRLINLILPEKEKKKGKVKMLKIYIKDEEGEEVNIKLPLVLIKYGLKFIPKDKIGFLEDKDINLEEILSSITDETEGEIVDIKSEEGEVIKIWIE